MSGERGQQRQQRALQAAGVDQHVAVAGVRALPAVLHHLQLTSGPWGVCWRTCCSCSGRPSHSAGPVGVRWAKSSAQVAPKTNTKPYHAK